MILIAFNKLPSVSIRLCKRYPGKPQCTHKSPTGVPQLLANNQRPKMQESEISWIFDSLVCFLNGPVWNVPLRNFIEEKSLIFDPHNLDGDEHRKIFQEYKNLVDVMLGSYMEDINISPHQFEESCNRGNVSSLPSQFDQNLFEQIWAANDYNTFKRMMAQRNVELQLEALQLLENKYGVTPQSFVPQGHSSHRESEQVMTEVSKQFSENISTINASDEEAKYLREEKKLLQEQLNRTEGKEENESAQSSSLDAEISFDKKPIGKEIDNIELKKRQEYLKSQRDKLVALKKEARNKQFLSEEKGGNRPKSAQVAKALIDGKTAPPRPELNIRKSLVERLKNEIMSKADKQ